MPKITPKQFEQIKEEAKELIKDGYFIWRSCWKCNPSHEHLKESPDVISCFECDHWFYKGKDITNE